MHCGAYLVPPQPHNLHGASNKMHGSWILWLASVFWSILSHASPLQQYPFRQRYTDVTASRELLLSECPNSGARPVLRVAIIGAGVSGTSSAYFLSTAQEKLNRLRLREIPGCANSTLPEHISITVYERTGRVGGRVYGVHPLNDSSIMPVEIGASIYADINKNMARAVKALRFKSISREILPGSRLGLWDGKEFIFNDFKGSKWDYWKLYWRYGSSPRTLLDLYAVQH